MNNLFGRNTTAPSRPSSRLTKQKAMSESIPYFSGVQVRAPATPSRVNSDVVLSTTRTSSRDISVRQQPLQAETYWAARALRSETLLAARTAHHEEVRGILSSAEIKRARALSELKREHDARHARLEAIVLGLFLLLLILASFVFYLLTSSTRHQLPVTSRWSFLPSHFTIPILSPFTSVVESESAVIGARSIAIFAVVLGAVAYGLVRPWLENRPSPT